MARAKKAAPDAAEKTEVTAATAAPETTAKAETKSAAAENQTAASYIYVGVSLPGIPANTTITGNIPTKLDVPFVRELVIPTEALSEFIKKKSVTNSREAFCYRKSVEYAKELSK